MYCPVCLNDTLSINSRGVIHVIVNGKQMDTGRFLFNTNDPHIRQVSDLEKKLEEFFKWYSGFQNAEPITVLQLITSDVICESGCKIPLTNKSSVIDILYSGEDIQNSLNKMGEKYSLKIKLE